MASCSSCKAPITWAKTENGKAAPINPDPVWNGNIELVHQGADGYLAVYVDPEPNVQRHVSHFTTCPDRDKHRKIK